MKPVIPSSIIRHRAAPICNDGCAARHSFNHDQAKWLWPIDAKEQGASASEKVAFAGVVQLAKQCNLVTIY
jgi:hypothetical protein